MSDLEERDVERPGIGRRTLIKRAAATGAVAWAAPTIIGSLRSPAGAVTGGFPATCSYMILVVQTASEGPCAIKVVMGATSCTNENNTSADNTFSAPCGGHTYTNTCNGTAICREDFPTGIPACTSACPSAVTISGGTVTANPGTSILFAVAHAGSCSGGPGTHFCPACCGVTSCNAGC
jgi:hypothetical protein